MQTPEFLIIEDVLDLHRYQIAEFGGTPGLRDRALLESAVAQPQASFGGQLLHATLAEQAAAYLYHIAMNHPFLDGNKRTAAIAMELFVRLNGGTVNLSDSELYDLVLGVVTGSIEKEGLAGVLGRAIAAPGEN